MKCRLSECGLECVSGEAGYLGSREPRELARVACQGGSGMRLGRRPQGLSGGEKGKCTVVYPETEELVHGFAGGAGRIPEKEV